MKVEDEREIMSLLAGSAYDDAQSEIHVKANA